MLSPQAEGVRKHAQPKIQNLGGLRHVLARTEERTKHVTRVAQAQQGWMKTVWMKHWSNSHIETVWMNTCLLYKSYDADE